jgi:DNA/RNA-binding domain of Phe-tRNA-synthetase-like protein|tara:strand:+ start:3912 stop:4571 length:660 start_codon:yes stop_codon:yes gene_type:complete
MELKIDKQVRINFPNLSIIIKKLDDIIIEKNNNNLENYKTDVLNEIYKKYNLSSLKDERIFRIYRNFFWEIGVDPTKIRPAAEALIKRVLTGKTIPKINNLVDTYNLTSIKTGIPLAAFDNSKIINRIIVRFAEPNEKFYGIGMKEPQYLKGNEVIITDEEKIIAVYPYRDSNETKITNLTKSIQLMICGVPQISEDILLKTESIAIKNITKFCIDNKK